MGYEITGWERDVAGKFRYYVIVQGAPVSFKFHEFPTDEEVQAEAARYDAELQRLTAEALLAQEQADGAPNPE